MRMTYQNKSSLINSSKRILIIWAWILLQCSYSYGQLQLVPLGGDDKSNANAFESKSPLRTQASLNLPFFDDFSSVKNATPGSKNWLPGSGVYINNSLTSSHPSLNIATFDGLNATGTPYNLINPLNQGFTDTLTSQPVNLSGKTAADSVYISFYWMAKGLGELPDSSDYFQLEFLSRSNEWVTVWKQVGYNLTNSFIEQFVKITDPAYLYDAFQFRFRSYGRNSGPYDTWHLDYVHLNAKRSSKQPYIFDVALRKPLTPYLKKYTSMPLRQYRVDPKSAVSDSVGTDIVNHFNNFNILTGTFTISDQSKGTEYFRNVQRSIYVESLKPKVLQTKLTPVTPAANVDSVKLLLKYFVTTTDTIPNVNLKSNDTITSRIDLSDYYAFDDGSAEYGVQINQKLSRVAVRYMLSKPDTIGGVRMAMVAFNKDIAGQGFTVQIFSNRNGRPDQMIAQRSVGVRYSGTRNGFIDYAFASPVAVPDTFYVGWLQINEQPVTVGFDRNSLLGKDHVFYNLGTEWVKEAGLNGSIMIRPYLGKKATGVVTGNEPALDNSFSFFPNPNKGTLNWNHKSLKKIEILSVQGKLLQTIIPENNMQSANVGTLTEGIYHIKASDGKRSSVQKMLIVK
ncbi:T9SS type A sorting domain-containing protein [Dyadobacter flavalbus]|nr:T9SS type A sorting domain-containing protein [Dyadobacter flavalbus]